MQVRKRFFLILTIALTTSYLSAEKKPSRSVKPDELTKLIQQADKLVVYADEMQPGTVLYSSADRKDLDELNAAIEIDPGGGVFCACIGKPGIRLLRQGKVIGYLTNQSGHAISTSLWAPDAVIRDREKWLHWFDARGIAGPRQEVEEQIALEKQSAADEERWMKAMPAGLREPWSKLRFAPWTFHADLKPLDAALLKEFPDQRSRILALLHLFGSGAGPWSGFPAYESVVEEMLLEYSTADLLAAVTDPGSPLTDQQIEGTARLFSDWDFNQKRPQDNKLIPPGLKRTLLEHSLKSTDEDKVGRARDAFEPATSP
jgi:hypothetical protein